MSFNFNVHSISKPTSSPGSDLDSGGEWRGDWYCPKVYLDLEKEMENDSFAQANGFEYSLGIVFRNTNSFYASAPASSSNFANFKGFKTSDGGEYANPSDSITHYWDSAKDLEGGYRWIILYSSKNNAYDVFGDCQGKIDNKKALLESLYQVLNFDITQFANAAALIGSNNVQYLESFKFINNHKTEFYMTLYFGKYYSLKYCPSIEELGNPTVNPPSTTTYNFGGDYALPNLPYGLDLSLYTKDITIGRVSYLGGCTRSAYITLPNANVTLTYSAGYPEVLFTKDNWEYIAEHAPTVSGKKLTMNASNILICGGEDGEIITKLKSKGWVVA